MITNTNPAEWLRCMRECEADDGFSVEPIGGGDFNVFHRDRQPGIPGAIIAEFAEVADATLFMRLKGVENYTVTAGVNQVWAVRRKFQP